MEINHTITTQDTVRISDMTWEDFREKMNQGCKVAVLPVGSVEQHGPHLPFGCDTYFAHEFATRMALGANEIAGKPLALVYPPVWYGNGGHWSQGEVWLRPTTLVPLYADLFEQILKQGFQYLVVVSGHGGNASIIYNAINESQFNGVEPRVFYSCPWSMMWDEAKKIKETTITGHACELETSTSLFLFPELVKMDRLEKKDTDEPEYWVVNSPYQAVRDEKVEHLSGGGQVGQRPGYVGDPTKASFKKGEQLVKAWTDEMVKFLLELDQP